MTDQVAEADLLTASDVAKRLALDEKTVLTEQPRPGVTGGLACR